MVQFPKFRTLALAATIPAMAMTAPMAQAAEMPTVAAHQASIITQADAEANLDRRRDRDRYSRYGYGRGNYRDYRDSRYERVNRNTRVWRGDNGRYYCQKENGTTGLLIGGAVGGLAGHEIAKDKTLGAILGAAGGALLGRAIDKSDAACR